MTVTTRSVGSVDEPTLYVALELSNKNWTLALSAGMGTVPWVRGIERGDWARWAAIVQQARAHFGLPATARIVSCYEAGRDGFWIHRALIQRGVANRVVDSASIEVNRRARRLKTDRIDARKLLTLLIRVVWGDTRAWQEVRVPTVAEEAARQVSRERTSLVQEQTRLKNQVRGLVTLYGVTRLGRGRAWWTRTADWAGLPLPADVQARLARLIERSTQVAAQLRALETQQAAALAATPPDSPGRRLLRLKGVADTSVSVLLDEGLVWRAFRNRREVGGLLGFTAVPHESGTLAYTRGISGAGNRRLQAVAIQLAWNWVRWQKASALTQWYLARFGTGKRARRIGIVALARKLMIALWRYATSQIVPTGAVLKVIE